MAWLSNCKLPLCETGGFASYAAGVRASVKISIPRAEEQVYKNFTNVCSLSS